MKQIFTEVPTTRSTTTRSTTSDIGAGVNWNDFNDNSLVWTNPCPDASAPTAPPAGSVKEMMIGPMAGVGTGKSMFNPCPNASLPLVPNGSFGVGIAASPIRSDGFEFKIPTVVTKTFPELIETVKEEFRKLETEVSVQRQEIVKLKNTASSLSIEVEKYKFLYSQAIEKLEKIKKHIAE
jgi:hypothetical protein